MEEQRALTANLRALHGTGVQISSIIQKCKAENACTYAKPSYLVLFKGYTYTMHLFKSFTLLIWLLSLKECMLRANYFTDYVRGHKASIYIQIQSPYRSLESLFYNLLRLCDLLGAIIDMTCG